MAEPRTAYVKMMANGPDGWLGKLLFWGLVPLSLLFGLIVRLRTLCYRVGWLATYSAGVPVISVGNLTVGGTGKTPVVDYLVKWFAAKGVKTAVVSRGYGGTYKEPFERVIRGSGEPAQAEKFGDEPYLLALQNPQTSIYVARDRWRGVAAAEADGAKCIILDDAFQHYRLRRDLDIVLLDAKQPFGNGTLLPAGPLREGKGALQRADLLILTRAEADQEMSLEGDKPVCFCSHQLGEEVTSLSGETAFMTSLKHRKGFAFAAIASPESFFHSLTRAGLFLAATKSLADHSQYDADICRRLKRAAVDADYLITTAKDAVKLSAGSFDKECFVTQLRLKFHDESPLERCLNEILGKVKLRQETTQN